MGKPKSTRSNPRTTVQKVKKLTPRRISMITNFLTQSVRFPAKFGVFETKKWVDNLIEHLNEPRRYRSTRMDILAWLDDDCFQELIDHVIIPTAFKTGQLTVLTMYTVPPDSSGSESSEKSASTKSSSGTLFSRIQTGKDA